MAKGKCNLLKPVDNLTGTFFMFSQYAQDLTQQYTKSDAYRCVPSKYMALNLDFTKAFSTVSTEIDKARVLGEIFQNYYENSCAFLRSMYNGEDDKPSWTPEDARTLLFQTLQKYELMKITPTVVDILGNVDTGTSTQIQNIGDINVYSYEDSKDGLGYNEIYCYIPNESRCKDYELTSVVSKSVYNYGTSTVISGYSSTDIPYNYLNWGISNYIDKTLNEGSVIQTYCSGKYSEISTSSLNKNTLIPQCLIPVTSDDKDRLKPGSTTEILDVFDINAIVLFYDIVRKSTNEDEDTILHHNIPLGIYFTGSMKDTGWTNIIHKFVNNNEIYNQGTSYGLRVCSRFLAHPNSTELLEVSASGSTNVSEIAPVMEEMGNTLVEIQKVLKDDDKLYNLINNHLAQFKYNNTNIPYVRQLGSKKYWFVNGKNTGAVAEYEMAGLEDIIKTITEIIFEKVYSKDDIDTLLKSYVTTTYLDTKLSEYVNKTYVDDKFTELESKLKVWYLGEPDPA